MYGIVCCMVGLNVHVYMPSNFHVCTIVYFSSIICKWLWLPVLFAKVDLRNFCYSLKMCYFFHFIDMCSYFLFYRFWFAVVLANRWWSEIISLKHCCVLSLWLVICDLWKQCLRLKIANENGVFLKKRKSFFA